MKIIQILLLTFSTVSIIHCSQQSDQNEDSKASYHIEFEDKNANGGYGYKVHVSGKSKYQETWKKDKKPVSTPAPIATGTLDYSQSNYAVSTNNFVPKVEPLTKSEENNFAQDSYISNPVTVTNQYSRKPSSQNSASSKSQQISKTPTVSSNFVPQTKSAADSVQNQHFQKTPTYAQVNSFTSYDKQVSESELQAALQNSLNSQTYNLNKSPVQYASSDDFVPINFQESKSAQNSYIPQNYGSSNQEWQVSTEPSSVSSSYYASKPSLQIMNQYSDNSNYNFAGSSQAGPQVYVESTSGKINHNQFTNQFESKPQQPQVSLQSEADLSNYYLQNYQHSVTSTAAPQTEIPPHIEYYQPVSHSKENYDYKTLAYANQYASQLPSVPLTQSASIPENHSSDNSNYYSPINYSTQYGSSVPVNQYSTIEGITSSKDNIAQKPIQYAPQITAVPSTKFVSGQEIKHTKGNTIHKSVSSSINYAPQHQSVSFTQYAPVQQGGYSTENNLFTPAVSTNQYASSPITQFSPHAQENIYYNPSALTSQYASETPSVPSIQYASQQTVQYVPQQNVPSYQGKPSVQLPIDYSQLLQQYPIQFSQGHVTPQPTESKEIPQQHLQYPTQFSQGHVTAQPTESKEIPQQYLQYPTQFSQEHVTLQLTKSKEIPQQYFYNTVQQPVANKQVVSYHYKQELPPTTSQTNISPNNVPNTQYIKLNSYTPKDLANTYNALLNGFGQHSLTGLGNVGNGIPLSPYGVYGNAGIGKGNHQNLYAPGLTYRYGTNGENGHGLLNINGYTDIASGYPGSVQFANMYNTQRRRSSEKIEDDKKYVADQKQTE